MKRTLLLSALAAFGLASMAQTQLQEVNLSGRNAVTTLSLNQKAVNKARKALQANKMGARITSTAPSAFYARPAGCFWAGADNQFNAYQGYLIAPANIALSFQGIMVGEKCKWMYADPAQKVTEDQRVHLSHEGDSRRYRLCADRYISCCCTARPAAHLQQQGGIDPTQC